MPGAAIEPKLVHLRREDFLVLKPGSKVKFDFSGAPSAVAMEGKLREQVKGNGWIVDPSATAVIKATIQAGESQTVTYNMGGLGGHSSQQSVTFSPQVSKLEIVVSGKSVWRTSTGTGAPPVILLTNDQTLAHEVKKWQSPNFEFFGTATLPSEVVDPEKLNKIGVAEVSNKGITIAAAES
jgi:hypothetical protein